MAGSNFLNSTCLKSTYSLRAQLMVSYGCTALLTTFAVVIIAIVAANKAGRTVQDKTTSLLRDQVLAGLQKSEFQVAELFTIKFQNLRGSSALLAEIVRDRIVDYPNNFDEGQSVPFFDIETGESVYPLEGEPLPRDFEVVSNWSPDTMEEHAQERADSLLYLAGLYSTTAAMFTFQGNCDPNETDPSGAGYLEGCTEAHNDAELGGVINTVATLPGLAKAANDIGILMKPLWEAEESAFQLNVFFFNNGTGATVTFPSFRGHSAVRYVSAGCEWMRTTNPYTGRPYGGDEQIARCRPAGTVVPIRYYNPMEREFCQDQVLNPGKIRIFGPYIDGALGQWRLSLGQATYDRVSGEFIGCTAYDLNLALAEDLVETVTVDDRTHIAVATLDGTIVAGGNFSSVGASTTASVVESGFVDQDTYEKLTQNKFWETTWDSSTVAAFKNEAIEVNGQVITSILSPHPPDEYDPDYEPDFWVFVAADVDDVISFGDDVDDAIDGEVRDLILKSISTGLTGLIIFLMVVAFVSHNLTRPLNWMESTAWKIINHADESMSEKLVVQEHVDSDGSVVRCSPKTEIHELVTEFQAMIKGFSGTGAARVAPMNLSEVKNFVTWKEEFRQFYQLDQTMEDRIKEEMSQKAQDYGKRLSLGKRSRGNNSSYGPTASDIIANFSEVSIVSEEDATFRSADIRRESNGVVSNRFSRTDSSTLFKRPITRTNLGSNLPMDGTYGGFHQAEGHVRVSRSKLFRLVLCSLVLPLLLTNVVIAAFVARDLLDSFPGSAEKADNFSYQLELDYLREAGKQIALYGRQVLPGFLRDLHLLTRLAGWLLFDAIPRSNGFSEMDTGMTEECKFYLYEEVCPLDVDNARTPCSCEWDDPWESECENYSVRTRNLQKSWYACQARDFDPETGERSSSASFPEFDFNAVSTKWFTDVEDMPGFDKGTNASGYETTYDRLRVLSALQVVSQPMYNYFTNDGVEGFRTSLSSYVALEADGSIMGYAGCNYDVSRFAQFKSTEGNEAYIINPELCPVGKYGYDPRCREWYAETKNSAQFLDIHTTLSSPYAYANSARVGTTASSAIVDPVTNEYVGTAGVDFTPTNFLDKLESVDCDFYFVVSPVEGNDATVGPDHSFFDTPLPIGDVVLPFDTEGSKNRLVFENITETMKEGHSGVSYFTRTMSNGQELKVALAFAPVYARVLKPVQPNDFSRGAEASSILAYSIGIAKYESTLSEPLTGIERDIDAILRKTVLEFIASVAAITIVCIFVTAKISVAVTKPMLVLLQVVQRVNSGRIEYDMPPLKGGSREATKVYSSFSKLYKIVRMSNSSFFLGDYARAHYIAQDALKLFRKIGDEKAVAIACNNIGNTLLALSVQKREKNSCLFVEGGACCVHEAISKFDEAIEIGTKEFAEGDTDAKKATYAQQLGDRHFNRAMCLLHSLDDSCCPEGAKEKAYADILRCREYCRGVQEYLLHEKLMFKQSDVVFERWIRRIHALSFLFSLDSTVWQIWDVNEIVEQADLMLQAAWDQANAPLFRDVTRVGRLQQLEGAVVELELVSGRLEEATQLSMRMLVEDEFLIGPSFVTAADTLLRYMKEPNSSWTKEAKLRTSLEFRRMRRAGNRTALDIERCFVFCVELGNKQDAELLSQVYTETISLYEEQCNAKDSVGIVSLSSSPDSNVFVHLAPKEKIDIEQKEGLETALSRLSHSTASPSLPTALKMVASPSRSRTSDVFLIFITDGSTWDENTYVNMQEQIRKVSSKRTASFNVIAIGIEVEDENFSDHCQSLCLATRSRHSHYLAANRENIASVFESAANLISSGSSSESNRVRKGMTMQRF
eukprot:Nitzschia sp. Nitz4//scaffold43_size134323//100713//106351//NITZ4_003315-RA/size134323-augustus-gene-0.225-mRNA-1//1//CDS//3329551996//3346//frame0